MVTNFPHSCVNTGTTLTGQRCLACAALIQGPVLPLNDPGPFVYIGPVDHIGEPYPPRLIAGRDV